MFNAMAGWCFDYYYLCRQKGTVSGYARNVNRYEVLNVVNRGSYGVVYRAMDKTTGEIVAMKHEFHGLSQSTLREIGILTSLPRHPSIVEFRNVLLDNAGVFVVMEYLESDLKRFMEVKKMALTVSEVKMMMKQILGGVNFLHQNGVMHRDLKPSNILINRKAELKICDFGLSRHMGSESGRYSPGVVTLSYRAPEVLLGAEMYSSAIDMWSVGCIMAELVMNQVLFKGASEIQLLGCIFKIRGTPSALRVMLYEAALLSGGRLVLSALGIDLLERLLSFDPKKRITAKEALDHKWFREYYGLLV